MDPRSVFLVAPPGLEAELLAEALTLGVPGPRRVAGGVEVGGGWEAVRRANLRSRIASRVLARLASVRAAGFPQLDAALAAISWDAVLDPSVPVKVEATAARSRLAHGGAVGKRVEAALRAAGYAMGDGIRVLARLERDVCTISVDTSGEPLHRRGFKLAVNRAPLRETLASGLLRACGWDGTCPLLDPMCGSGTIPIEAAEIAAGLDPGRARRFAFERLRTHDAARWDALRAQDPHVPAVAIHGSDRDAGAVAMGVENAARAGVAPVLAHRAVSDLAPPPGGPGLVLTNPPYGERIGGRLQPLYGALGGALRARFGGWEVGIVCPDARLVGATGLALEGGPLIAHGGIKVRLWRGRVPGGAA